jgi:hypothetical protein
MLPRTLLATLLSSLLLPVHAQSQITSDQLQQHVAILASDSLLGRGFGTDQGAEAASYIARQFKEAGLEPLNGSYLHPFNYRQGILNISGMNVAGVIPGGDPELRDEFIILGAHYDHLGWKTGDGDTVVYNGADDNASGTASIIEIGRSLVEKRDSLGRSVVIVAFDGEESGLIGSTRFVKDTLVPLHKIKLMFSLDMVGMYDAHEGVDLHGVNRLDRADLLTGDLARTHQLAIRKANGRIGQRTDTAPFGNIGIPAIHVFTGSESPYHKPEDVAGKLDYEGMASIANYIEDATAQLSNMEKISDWPGPGEGEMATGPKTFRAGVRINAGSGNHIYKDEFYDGKSIFAFETGVFTNIRLTKTLSLQPEILYETKGSQHEEGKYRTHAVTVPVSLQFGSPEQATVRTFIQVGGYYSYHFGGKLGDGSIDYKEVFTPHEFGFTYGIGIEVMNVQMGFYGQRGLSSILQQSDLSPSDILPQNFYFMLGFIF